MTRNRWTAGGGIAAILLGCVLPWYTGPLGISLSGIAGYGEVRDGAFLAVGALLAGAASLLGAHRDRAVMGWLVASIVLSALIGVVAIADMAQVANVPAASLGPGLPIVLIGTVALIVATAQGWRPRRPVNVGAPSSYWPTPPPLPPTPTVPPPPPLPAPWRPR